MQKKIRLAIIAAGEALGFETPEGSETPKVLEEPSKTVEEIIRDNNATTTAGYQENLDYWRGTGQDEETTYKDLVRQGLIIDPSRTVQDIMRDSGAIINPDKESEYQANLDYWRATGQDEQTTYNDLVRQELITGPLYSEETEEERIAREKLERAEIEKRKIKKNEIMNLFLII